MSEIEIKMLSTGYRCYKVNTLQINATMVEIVKNPEIYRKREDFDEKMNLEQVELYSEKSQEYEREIDGDFISEVFDEDTNMFDDMLKGRKSGLGTKNTFYSILGYFFGLIVFLIF